MGKRLQGKLAEYERYGWQPGHLVAPILPATTPGSSSESVTSGATSPAMTYRMPDPEFLPRKTATTPPGPTVSLPLANAGALPTPESVHVARASDRELTAPRAYPAWQGPVPMHIKAHGPLTPPSLQGKSIGRSASSPLVSRETDRGAREDTPPPMGTYTPRSNK